MSEIQLLYVKNVISRKKSIVQQQLYFFMLVENVGYDKAIDVLWAGEDGEWHILTALFHSSQNQSKEYWFAKTTFGLSSHQSLPGNIQFALRYQVSGEQFWDNKGGLNYSSEADSGIELGQNNQLLHIDFKSRLDDSQRIMPVTVAVDKSLNAEKVYVHWTTNNWQHTHKSACDYRRNYWNSSLRSNARNPNQYGVQIWQGQIKTGQAYRLQYFLSCESEGEVFRDTNFGNNYSVSRKQLKVLILNLHCYQEDQQDYKFSQIAKAINELEVDIVCFQEVAENWNDGEGDWDSNSAKIINDRLQEPYHIFTDWSHLGFEKYREGVAILSRYPMSKQEAQYVSNSHDSYSIHSRKLVATQVKVPNIGLINVFSAHLSWWEDGFEEQFERLSDWATAKRTKHTKATLLCGDFNITAGSEGYYKVVNTGEYEDQYLAANSQGLFEKIFRVNDLHWQDYLTDDYRIDYIFMNKTSDLSVVSAQVLFTEKDYGIVSDHCGYIMAFEPK
jgi:maltose 6'-phosphate phosphatase